MAKIIVHKFNILIAGILAYPDIRRRRDKGKFPCSSVAQKTRIKLNAIKNKPGSSALCALAPFFFSSVNCAPQWVVLIQHVAPISAAHRA